MDLFNGAPVGQALLFSAIAYLVPLALGWWLFFSRTVVAVGAPTRPTVKQANWLVLLLAAALTSLTSGGMWDAMKHVKTGIVPAGADFLWAPHMMIYGSFLVMYLVALVGFGALAVAGRRAGVRDPRLWVRQNPLLGALALAALYAILSVPGDAIWHQIFGVDLTAWSLPHVALDMAGNAAGICTLAIFLQSAKVAPRLRSLVTVIFLGMMINSLCLIGTLEWEIPGSLNLLVMHRPAWLYPVVFGGISFFMIMLAHRIVPRWGATGTALAAYGIRGALTGIMAAAHYPTPRFLPVMLLGAILLDAVPWERVQNAMMRTVGMALLFTGGYLAVARPLLNGRPGLRPLAPGDTFTAVAVTFAVCLVLLPLANAVADRLAGAPSAATPVTPGYRTM